MILSWGILGSGLAAEDILFNRLGVQDGLSSNEITCILKDRKGFMWLGTTSGVNRFDGYEFKHYKYKESGLPLGRSMSPNFKKPLMGVFGLPIIRTNFAYMSPVMTVLFRRRKY